MNIILVHGACADGSSWSKVIPILQNAGHKVIAGGPVVLVGHSYGGFVITNAAYDNPNIKGLVYIAAHAPKANP